MQKDIELALDAGRRVGSPLPAAERADELLQRAKALGYERRDIVAFLTVLEDMAGDRKKVA
jgi:3-hydroxyisobutyrate dehydrogenase-like beta-hydroxyacid dehydrogenase